MSYEALVALLVLLVAAHWGGVMYRLHKAESELIEMRKDFTASVVAAAQAAVTAAQAIAAAAAAVAAGNKK